MLICKRLAKRSNIQLLKITKEKKEPRDRVGKITDLWSHARHRCRMEPFQGRIRRSTWSLPPLWNRSKIKLLKFLKIKYLKLVITEKKNCNEFWRQSTSSKIDRNVIALTYTNCSFTYTCEEIAYVESVM